MSKKTQHDTGKTNCFRRTMGLATLGGTAWLGYKLVPWLRYFTTLDVPAVLAAHENRALPGFDLLAETTTDAYTMRHTLEDGIERIVYTPTEPRHDTPILMVHGMWHGAWCWQGWQEYLASQGWQSIAISLPGHGASFEQRPFDQITLDYYLGFVKAEIERLDRPPVMMGHSMGGALTQWVLKYVGQEHLAAAVFVAAWVSHSVVLDAGMLLARMDPLAIPLMILEETAAPMIRTPAHAQRLLSDPRATLTAEELHRRLGPESVLVMMQHNPPFWKPAEDLTLPMLWLGAENDAVITLDGARRSAAHYGAEFMLVPESAHNIMHAHNQAETVQQIHDWLTAQELT